MFYERKGNEIFDIQLAVIPNSKVFVNGFFSTPCDERGNEVCCTFLAANTSILSHSQVLLLRDEMGTYHSKCIYRK